MDNNIPTPPPAPSRHLVATLTHPVTGAILELVRIKDTWYLATEPGVKFTIMLRPSASGLHGKMLVEGQKWRRQILHHEAVLVASNRIMWDGIDMTDHPDAVTVHYGVPGAGLFDKVVRGRRGD